MGNSHKTPYLSLCFSSLVVGAFPSSMDSAWAFTFKNSFRLSLPSPSVSAILINTSITSPESIVDSKQRKFWQRKFFAKKRMQRKQRKIFLEICHFWEILPWKSQFFGHSLIKITFSKHFINKMSVTEKSFFKNPKFYGICVTTFIYYYKIENNYVISISKIFFAFFVCFCKEFEIFFASLQRMKMQRIHPI